MFKVRCPENSQRKKTKKLCNLQEKQTSLEISNNKTMDRIKQAKPAFNQNYQKLSESRGQDVAKSAFIKIHYSSFQNLSRLKLTDRQFQYCLAIHHYTAKKGFILKENNKFYRGSNHKIRQALGIKRRQFQAVLDTLERKGILYRQLTIDGKVRVLFQNIFKGYGKFVMVPLWQKDQFICSKGFRLKVFIQQCIKESQLDPNHDNPNQLKFKMHRTTSYRHRLLLAQKQCCKNCASHSIYKNKFLYLKNTSGAWEKILKSKTRKIDSYYWYKGSRLLRGKKFDPDSIERAKEKGNFVSSFHLIVDSRQPKRKRKKNTHSQMPPGLIEAYKHGGNSITTESNIRKGIPLDHQKQMWRKKHGFGAELVKILNRGGVP